MIFGPATDTIKLQMVMGLGVKIHHQKCKLKGDEMRNVG